MLHAARGGSCVHHVHGNHYARTPRRLYATASMPYRPGYGLGSWLPPGLIEGMKTEAKLRSRITLYSQIEGDLESTQREYLMEQNRMTNDLDKSQTLPQLKGLGPFLNRMQKKRQEITQKKLETYMNLFNMQETLMNMADTGTGPLSFSTFASSMESPVDFDKSRIAYKDRAYDSLSVNASYIDTDTDKQSAHSSAASVSAAVEASGNSFFGNNWSASLSAAAAHNMSKTAEQHDIESTLLVTCFATHRKVQLFAPLITDPDLLLKAWNFYVPDQTIVQSSLTNLDYQQALGLGAVGYGTHPGGLPAGGGGLLPAGAGVLPGAGTAAAYTSLASGVGGASAGNLGSALTALGNTLAEQHSGVIYLLTEVYLGSSIVGMVHFLKKKTTTSKQSSNSATTEAMASMKRGMMLSSLSGSTGLTASIADKLANSLSRSGLEVKFDMTCLGYMPTLKSSVVKQSVKEFRNFDPATFAVENDKGMFPDMQGIKNTLLSDEKSQVQRQSNTGAVIKATLMGLKETESRDLNVIDMDTFLNVLDDFSHNAPTKEGVGVPIGMNVRPYNRRDIVWELAKKYYKDGPTGTSGGTSGSTRGSTSGGTSGGTSDGTSNDTSDSTSNDTSDSTSNDTSYSDDDNRNNRR